MRIFIDTGYYIARIMPHDQWRQAARQAVRPGMTYFTSSLVVNETISLLQARGHFSAALTFLERVRQSETVQILYPDPVLQSEAWDLFATFGASGANAVDCLSFAVMNRLGILRAFTFDGHFRVAGFETLH